MNLISEITQYWGWTGIEPEEVVGENDFGNLMIRDASGKYWRLCPEDLYCEVVANDRPALDALSSDQDFLNDWYMKALVEKAMDALGPLEEGRKYYLVIPGVLGGAYDISNIKTASVVEIISRAGDIAQQIKDLPDGTKIRLDIEE